MRCILSLDLTQHRPQTITSTTVHLRLRAVRYPCARSAHLDGRRADGNRDDGQGGWDGERPLRVHQLGRSEQCRRESSSNDIQGFPYDKLYQADSDTNLIAT